MSLIGNSMNFNNFKSIFSKFKETFGYKPHWTRYWIYKLSKLSNFRYTYNPHSPEHRSRVLKLYRSLIRQAINLNERLGIRRTIVQEIQDSFHETKHLYYDSEFLLIMGDHSLKLLQSGDISPFKKRYFNE
jgi:hypothetical protein